MLQKALGAGHQFVDPQLGKVGYTMGDRFLICSDGLTDGLYNDRLQEILDSTESDGNPAEKLVLSALQLAARDNITALVIEAK